MPHHKSCKKRMLTTQRDNLKNRAVKSQIKTATKKVVSASDKESATTALKTAYSVIDKAVKRGVIHKNKAANQKARLATLVNTSA